MKKILQKKILYYQKKLQKDKKGFIILIAIVVSSLLVSMGMFIANVAYKELILSASTKASQQAFFVADSVIECALRHDIRGSGFRSNSADLRTNAELAISCGKFIFEPESNSWSEYTYVVGGGSSITVPDTYSDPDSASSTYYISYAEDTNNDNTLTQSEISAQPTKAYAKLVVFKYQIGTVNDKTVLKVFGRNKHSGVGQVERAIEVTY